MVSEKGVDTMKVEVSVIAQELAKIFKEKSLSRYAVSKLTGIPDSTLQNMFKKGSTPNLETLEMICNGLDMSVADFFRNSEAFEELTEDQIEVMEFYDQMDDRSRQLMLAYARGMMSDFQKKTEVGNCKQE